MNVLIADDHQVYRRGLRAFIQENHPEARITEASNGQEALDHLQKRRTSLPAEIVILDLEMPEVDGVETVKRLRDRMPDLKIIVITMHEDQWLMDQLVGMGVQGYLLKGDGEAKIEEAIQSVRKGRSYFSNPVSDALQREIVRSKRFRRNFHRHRNISEREMEVLRRICRGQTNREIAEALSISVRTVDNHRHHLLEKCGAKNTAELIVYAIRHGLIDISDL